MKQHLTSTAFDHLKRIGTPRSRRGITLAEVTISALLVGLVVVASLRSVGAVVRTWQVAAEDSGGEALAQQLLREILLQSYEDPNETPDWKHEPSENQSPTTRADFDDLDDYDDWSASPPQHPDGTPLTTYTGWIRSVIVQKLNDNNYNAMADNKADRGLRRITVTVQDGSGQTFTAMTYRSDLGGSRQPIGVDTTIVTWVGCNLQLGSSGESVSAGTHITNHAEDQ